jgi:tetratricopeptide (TPR) repeat protein
MLYILIFFLYILIVFLLAAFIAFVYDRFIAPTRYNNRRYSKAIEAFKQAIRINPNDAEAHYGLGMTYYVANDISSALEEYKILKNLNPELADELFNLIYEK